MAENDQWCQSLEKWEKFFYTWIDKPSPENLLNAMTFFDFRHVYGDGELSKKLRASLFKDLDEYGNRFFRAMSNEFQHHQVPLGFFNNFLVGKDGEHKDALDIKRVMNFFVEFARILSLEANINFTSTAMRLEELRKREVIRQDEYENYRHPWDIFLLHRLQHQIRLIEEGQESHNFINPSKLNTLDRDLLRSAFKLLSDLQLKIKLRFSPGVPL